RSFIALIMPHNVGWVDGSVVQKCGKLWKFDVCYAELLSDVLSRPSLDCRDCFGILCSGRVHPDVFAVAQKLLYVIDGALDGCADCGRVFLGIAFGVVG